ncbi:MAG: hypothetical protein QF645_09395, partial [Planctomycetota bacterium]|nr:hypothetical protein [Planctomycetota bacterium]
WVEVDSPLATDIYNPERVLVTVKTSQVQGSFQSSPGTPVAGNGGGGCGAPLSPGNAQGHLLLLGLPLLVLGFFRRASR